jgi:hypothetical protein
VAHRHVADDIRWHPFCRTLGAFCSLDRKVSRIAQ